MYRVQYINILKYYGGSRIIKSTEISDVFVRETLNNT